MKKNQPKGFTLVELLVVIAIIGILSTLAIVALGNARAKARDAKRVADIKQISTALELYYADNGNYPTIITPGNSLVSPDGTKTYMAAIPNNPSPKNDGDCFDKDYQYRTTNNTKYALGYCVSNNISDIKSGAQIASNEGISTCQPFTYEGQTYNVVAISSQCWMADSINVGTQLCIGGGAGSCATLPSDINTIEKYCYDNDPDICTSDGALYTWYEAVGLAQDDNSTISEPIKGICPDGWHIPTDDDFNVLENYLTDGDCDNARDDGGWFDCSSGGDKLKINSSCSSGDNCNTTNFSMILGGFAWYGAGNFSNRLDYGYLWESGNSATDGLSRNYASGEGGIARRSFDKSGKFQVRCIKD